ncbi:hypothetical protein HYH03_018191 [Edaphochlamys debaryana]|uniref:Uncharacterized protein n=1 Tax=Edaphochlamys debaryana TaxID=47281 RepID=A0A835XFS3_9CHLO|nr:hypothetical protein HYH03_018191 [Edaphochlamys debaryana]|eukprot:KAG2482911.1 hypothetical protein HYH03_018191 [Edaphochlamys debaryana]
MVFGREAAVVIKGRDGRTVLLHSRGLDVQQAGAAAAEAMGTLQAAGQNSDTWDILSQHQGAPLLCGRVEVMHSKFCVTYRVAGGLIFLLVTPPCANAFACVGMLGQVVRVVLPPGEAAKAAEATPERVQRRFAQVYLAVYLAVDALVGSGGVLEAGGALARASSTLEGLGEARAGDKGGKGDKAGAEAARPAPQGAGVGRITRRTLQGAIDALSRLSFPAGSAMDAAPPRPGFALPDGSVAPPPRQPQQVWAAADPFGDSDIFGAAKPKPVVPPGADPNDPFAASDPFAPLVKVAEAKEEKKPGDWQDFDGNKAKPADGFEDSAFGEGAAFAPPPPPMIPSEPVLRLSETWRGEAVGGRLARCGVAGRVEWASEGAKAKVHTVQFMVQPPEPANQHLAAALSAARRHPACTKPGRCGGLLVADGIAAKPHAGAPLLAYALPPVALAPPLQAHLGAYRQPLGEGRVLVTLGLHYAVSPRLGAASTGLQVDLHLPALLESPLRAAPPGAHFDAKASVLRWQLPAASLAAPADASGAAAEALVAVFVVAGAAAEEQALTAALARLAATLTLAGAEGGGSLSGASLAQGVVDLEATPALCGWRAELTVTL